MSEIRFSTDRESFIETARTAADGARVPVEARVTVPDPFEAYRRARDGNTDGFYLETTGGQSGWGYFGVDPVEQIEVSASATPHRTAGVRVSRPSTSYSTANT